MWKRLGCCGIVLALLLVTACDTGVSPVTAPSPSSSPPAAPVPPALTDAYVGNYTLTLDIGGECAIPEEARHRTYAATIDWRQQPGRFESSTHQVTLTTGTFRQGCGANPFTPGLGCHQFAAVAEGDGIRFRLNDFEWDWGGHIVEQMSGGAWMGIGYGNVLAHRNGSTITGSGKAEIFYCFDSSSGCTPAYCDGRFTDVQVRFTKQ